VLDELIARYPNKPILVTEFGAGCIAGLMAKPAGERRNYSEPGQADYLEAHLRQILDDSRADHLLGATWWLYRDFDDPHRRERYHPKEWHGVNTKGLITREGRRKMSYERFRAMARTHGFLEAEASGTGARSAQ
jgi:beta-glucuronidase